MLILTTSRAHNTSRLHTPEFTQSTEGLHLLHNDLKSIQMNILFHSLLIKAISKQSLTLEAHLVIKSFKVQSKHKTIFCYDLKTNNQLNARINRLFWLDSKSTTKNSFQPFSKHLSIKQSVVSTKQ